MTIGRGKGYFATIDLLAALGTTSHVRYPTRAHVLTYGLAVAGVWFGLLITPLQGQRVSVTPRIDGSSELFSRIISITPAPGNGVGVSDVSDPTVRVYGADGELLKVVGSRGSGPGEFRLVTKQGWVDKRLWVADIQLKRTTFFTESFRVARILPWPSGTRRDQGETKVELDFLSPPLPQAYLSDGTVIALVSFRGETSARLGLSEGENAALIHTDTAGVILNTIAGVESSSIPACRVDWQASSKLRGYVPIPYCQRSRFGISPSGRYIAVAEPRANVEDGTILVSLYDAMGKLLRQSRVVVRPVLIPRSVIDAELAKLREDLASGPPEQREVVVRMKMPTHYPLISDLMVMDDGVVLVKQWRENGTQVWKKLDPTLTSLSAEFPWPSDAHLVATTQQAAWIVTLDEDGIPSIARYPGPSQVRNE